MLIKLRPSMAQAVALEINAAFGEWDPADGVSNIEYDLISRDSGKRMTVKGKVTLAEGTSRASVDIEYVISALIEVMHDRETVLGLWPEYNLTRPTATEAPYKGYVRETI